MIALRFKHVPFSSDEMGVLEEDFRVPQDPIALYEKVTDQNDKMDLLQLAFTLFWSDSDFHKAEHKIFTHIQASLGLTVSDEI